MNKKLIALLIICIFSILLNGFLIFSIVKDRNIYRQYQEKTKVLDFRNFFEEKVLLSAKAIDFDTRLSLETAVRALNDVEIFEQWSKFANSATKEDATIEAKNLLKLLIKK